MIYIVDIDGTIANTENSDYKNSKPMLCRIRKINELYDQGHTIVYYTARGLKSGRGEKYYRPITEYQLEEWGCKYHDLWFKEHDATHYIDDKALRPEEFFDDTEF